MSVSTGIVRAYEEMLLRAREKDLLSEREALKSVWALECRSPASMRKARCGGLYLDPSTGKK